MSRDVLLRCICVLYLLITPGTAIVTKYVCPGDSIKVFQNVTFNSQDTVVSLLKNHIMRTLLAQWHMQNSTIKLHIQPDYKEKVYLDEFRNIWIRNVSHWDEESYFIESGVISSYEQYEVKIIIMVAPKKTCKPKITHLDKLLIAHLEAEDCGIPVASLQWLDYPGLSNISGPVINLPPGHEAGTYYVCLKSPALECMKISVPSDYCSSFTIGENDSPTDILDLKTAISLIVPSIIVIGSLVLLIVALYLILKIWRRCRAGLTSQRTVDQCCVMNENINREQTMPLMEIHPCWKKHFDKLNWEGVRQLLNGDQQKGLETYIDNLKSVNDNQRQVLETHSDSEHKTEDASNEHPTCTGPEKVTEVIEPCDDSLCKICFANTVGKTCVPCGHMATCTNCSISLQECPVCRTKLKALVSPFFKQK